MPAGAVAYTGCFFLARRRHAHAVAALVVVQLLTQFLSVVVNPHEAGPTGYFTVLIVFTSAATVGFRGVVLSSKMAKNRLIEVNLDMEEMKEAQQNKEGLRHKKRKKGDEE